MDVTQNGSTVNIPILDQQTLYASALVTVSDKGYTKHYFEEGKRICSKIGSGELRDINTLVVEFWDGYDKIQSYIEDGVTNAYQCIGIKPEVKTQDLYEDIIKKYKNPVNADEPVFYYHGDHLGSASYITNDNGNETQHLVYLPFGEDWVDLKYNTTQFETPYKFNGKEKDPETGYNNYGARYYYDHLSIFLSTDPMSDKYPHLSSYAYCANNPVMLIDPDGRECGDFVNENGKIIGSDGKKDNKTYLLKTTRNDFDSKDNAPVANISKEERAKTEGFIKANDGNTEAFQNNSIAYDNSTEIESDVSIRQSAYNSVKDLNDISDIEYSGVINKDNQVDRITRGTNTSVDIKVKESDKWFFHTHGSEMDMKKNGYDRYSYHQAPSKADVNLYPNKTGYQFGMGNKQIYISKGGAIQGYMTIDAFTNKFKK
jgi:RHS repeat-associated protein